MVAAVGETMLPPFSDLIRGATPRSAGVLVSVSMPMDMGTLQKGETCRSGSVVLFDGRGVLSVNVRFHF